MPENLNSLCLCWRRNLHMDRSAAARLVRGAAVDRQSINRMRAVLAEHLPSSSVAQLDDKGVIEQIIRRIETSEIMALPRRHTPGVWTDRDVVEAEQAEPVLATAAPQEVTWIEVRLVDMEGDPVPGERYRITMPDGDQREGKLDYRGRARVDNIDTPGECNVTFPDLDADAWERLGA